MNDFNVRQSSANLRKEPSCPNCGEALICSGRVVDAGRFKKWVDEWSCPVHGVVSPGSERGSSHPQLTNDR